MCWNRVEALFLNHMRVQSTNPLNTAKYQNRVFHFLAHKIAITAFWIKNWKYFQQSASPQFQQNDFLLLKCYRTEFFFTWL